ncbi:MAG: VWA domain-containing protein [Chloroflexi bacterium]|nr:VWA domain-containing protein [Chloroflexota bacterium]
MSFSTRYSRWDGSQDVQPFDPDALLDALSDDVMAEGDLRSALERLMRWGHQGQDGQRFMGLQQLLEQLRQRRQQEVSRHNLDSVMDDLRQRLEKIIETERSGIHRRMERAGLQPPRSAAQRGDQEGAAADGDEPDEGDGESAGAESPEAPGRSAGAEAARAPADGEQSDGAPGAQPTGAQGGASDPLRQALQRLAERKLGFLDHLPPDVGGRVKQLSDYEFMDPEAHRQFQELLQMLQQQLLGNYFQGMMQRLQQLSPDDLRRMREMVRDLNRMLRDKMQGREPAFQEFMQKHGEFFPGVQSFEELMEHLAQRMAQMQSLLESMSPEMRQQLQDTLDALLRDDRLRWDMAELMANLEQLMPNRAGGTRYPFRGDEPLTLGQAMELMDRLQRMDQLERQLREAQGHGQLDQIDPGEMAELLGEEARRNLEQLQEMLRVLEEAGYIQRRGNTFELTPRAIRRIGQKVLQDIFAKLKRDSFGRHAIEQHGSGGERTDESKAYEFGDPFLLDIQKTVMNAVFRDGSGTPVRLQPPDFEVYRTEYLTDASTVVLVDMSRSMLLRGCFVAAKKVALALHSLIRGQFPRDNLYIVGFSAYAHEYKPDRLPQLSWDEYEYGTNMQHAFMLARQLLARHKSGTRQVILITDGEPTAHLEQGHVFFSYPPTYRTLQETLREVVRCTREGIVINTFMLERGYYLTDFVNQMTRINRGRAFFSTPERLGQYVLVDYVNSKRKLVG